MVVKYFTTFYLGEKDMFTVRDPRSLFKYTAIFAYVLVGIDVLNIISTIQMGDTMSMIVYIITGSIALVCGFVFYLYSVMSLVNVIKYKNLLWIPAILLFFSDAFCAIFAIVAIVKFGNFVKILATRQQQMGNEEVFVGGNVGRKVVNVDCTVLDPKENEAEFKQKLSKLDMLRDSGSIDEEEYKRLRQNIINEYLR